MTTAVVAFAACAVGGVFAGGAAIAFDARIAQQAPARIRTNGYGDGARARDEPRGFMALYQAKRDGRNRVRAARTSTPDPGNT